MNDEDVVQLLLQGQNNLMWFNSNWNKLAKDFNNKFIAIENKEVIESDSDLDSLLDKLKSKGVDSSETMIKFISKIASIL
jgi:hypothetical protein